MQKAGLDNSILSSFVDSLTSIFGRRLQQILLYGSYARDEATPDSDIDVLVILDPVENYAADWDRCIDVAAEMAASTGHLFSVLICSKEDYMHRDHPLLRTIRREGIPIA
jgi:predicted nucleotidyltransferase